MTRNSLHLHPGGSGADARPTAGQTPAATVRTASAAAGYFARAAHLACKQRYAAGHEDSGDPAAAVNFFVEKDSCGESVADEGE